MSWIIGLILIGYALIFFEVLIPGGILGLLGFCCIVGASVAAHQEYGDWFASGLTFLLGGIGAIFLVLIELRWLEESRLGKAFFLGKSVSGSSNPPIAPDEVVGMEGKAATPLKPEGVIAIGDDRYDAFCEDGYVPKGTALSVSGKDGYRLKVRKL